MRRIHDATGSSSRCFRTSDPFDEVLQKYENKDVLVRIVNKDKLYEALNKQMK